MSQQIVPFDFQGNAVRVALDSYGEPWFHGNDVCVALGFGNPRQAIDSHVDPEDVQKLGTPTAGGVQQQNYINESGVYALIFGSTKPEARVFKHWVMHEVLPTIRKTGQYATPDLRAAADQNLEWADLIRSYMALYTALGLRGQRRLWAVGLALQKRHGLELETIAPLDGAATADRLLSPSQLGLALGKTAREVNQLLQDLGLQVHNGHQWISTDKGKPFCELRGMGKHGGSRHGKCGLRWRENATLSVIREYHSRQRETALRLVGR